MKLVHRVILEKRRDLEKQWHRQFWMVPSPLLWFG